MLIIILVFVSVVASATCLVPVKYKLHYTFGEDESLATYNGSVSIEFRATEDLTFIQLDYFGNITEIAIRDVNTSIAIDHFKYTTVGELAEQAYRLENDDGLVYKDHLYEMSIKFNGIDYQYHIGLERIVYKTQHGALSSLVYTDLTHKYRMIFPRFTQIVVDTKYELSITHSENLTALSNMPSTRIGNESLVTTKFDETPPIALHSFGFVVGDFASVKITNHRNYPITVYGPRLSIGSIYIFPEFVGQIFDAYEKYLKHEIPAPKLDFIAIPELRLTSITSYGLVMCRDSTIQYGRASLKPMRIIPTAAKAIGDHFFMTLYDSIGSPFDWIKDGLSSFLTVKMLEIIEPNGENLFKMISYHASFEIEHTLDSIRLSDANSRRDVRYTKSAALFQMISHVIGEDKFKKILQDSLAARIDVIHLLSQHFDSEPNFDEFATGWVNQRGYPIVKVDRNYTSGEFMVSQTPYGWSDLDGDAKWWIPYSIATKSSPNFDETKPDGWLSTKNKTISLGVPPNDWIILNKRSTGYFLVNYDERNWNLIIDELTNGNVDSIHPVNRDYLLTTAYLLMRSKEMSESMFFALFQYLRREVNPRPWFVANVILDEIVTRDLSKQYKTHLNEVIGTIFGGLYDTYVNDLLVFEQVEIVRMIAMKWACYAGHNKCLNDFEKYSNLYVQLVEYNPGIFLDGEIRSMMLCYGFQNESNYIKLYGNYQTASYEELIRNRIECHLHTNMFRSRFITDFIFDQVVAVDEDAIQLVLMSKFQDAVPDLIYEIFDCNFDQFRTEYDKAQRVEDRLAPFKTMNEMMRQFERYNGISDGGGINREKLDKVVIKIRTVFGDEAAEAMGYDLD